MKIYRNKCKWIISLIPIPPWSHRNQYWWFRLACTEWNDIISIFWKATPETIDDTLKRLFRVKINCPHYYTTHATRTITTLISSLYWHRKNQTVSVGITWLMAASLSLSRWSWKNNKNTHTFAQIKCNGRSNTSARRMTKNDWSICCLGERKTTDRFYFPSFDANSTVPDRHTSRDCAGVSETS